MEWEQMVLIAASVLAIVIVLYMLYTGLGTVQLPS